MRQTVRCAFLLVLAGCLDGPFVRDNPLDVAYDINARLVGVPDTIFSRGDTFTVSLQTDIPLPPEATLTWSGDFVTSLGGGKFRANGVTYFTGGAAVRVSIGPSADPRIVSKSFQQRQRPFRLDLHCDTACRFQGLYQPVQLFTQIRDSLGQQITTYPIVSAPDSLYTRDPSIVAVTQRNGPHVATVTPMLNGETWLIMHTFGMRALRDSVKLTVQQRPYVAYNNCNSGGLWIHSPDSTAQINITAFHDPFNNPLQLAWPTVVWAAGHPYPGETGIAEVSPTGAIKVIQRGGIWIAEGYIAGDTKLISVCEIYMP